MAVSKYLISSPHVNDCTIMRSCFPFSIYVIKKRQFLNLISFRSFVRCYPLRVHGAMFLCSRTSHILSQFTDSNLCGTCILSQSIRLSLKFASTPKHKFVFLQVWNLTAWPGGMLEKSSPNSNYTCAATSNKIGPGINSTIEIAVDCK